jgi:hypothetical protein
MPLAESVREHIGRNLLIVPYYGYGWKRQDLGKPRPHLHDSLGPRQFHVRLDELAYCGGEAIGGSGIIVQPKHEFNGYWCGFYLRRTDECNFTAKQGDYMVWIIPSKPQVQPSPEKALYEWVLFDKALPTLCGYGMVAETADYMGVYYERVVVQRKELLGESNDEQK